MASWLDRYRNHVIAALAALLAAAVVALVLEQRDGPEALEIRPGELTPAPSGPVEVYITGAVAHPGVYEMSDGDRAIDLLYEAGGPAPDANLAAVNLALRLHDEDAFVIPHLGQPASSVAGVTSQTVNINTATAEDLDAKLPGIGQVYGQRIVASRTADGPFASTDEMVERELIPRATFERIRELITVGP